MNDRERSIIRAIRDGRRELRRYVAAHAVSATKARALDVYFRDPIDGKKSMPRRVILVREWGRDCDQAERETLTAIPATLRAWLRAHDAMLDGAEGPCSMTALSADEAAEFKPSFRDRAAEAWENGRGANAYSV